MQSVGTVRSVVKSARAAVVKNCLNKQRQQKGLLISSAMALYSQFIITPAILVLIGLILISDFKSQVTAFPDGAPGEACVRHKPNHGGKAQPLTNMPFYVTASSSTYKPGETIAVKIGGKYGKYFKGFFVQASDERGRWVGHFEPTDFSVSHPECAATTHSENREKEEITLIWHPPNDSSGTVRFLASILKTYKLYWVDAPAITPSSKPTKSSVDEEAENNSAEDTNKNPSSSTFEQQSTHQQ